MYDLQKAKDFFENDKYATVATGIEIVEVAENYAKCSLVINENHRNAVGGVMGGVYFTLADFVFAISTNFEKETVTVSTVAQINFLATPKGDMLFAESKLIKDGRSTCLYEVYVTDSENRLIALIAINGQHLIKN